MVDTSKAEAGPSGDRGDPPVVELRDVGVSFGELTALTGINLSVRRGEVVVLLGPSGSGKSTLVRTVNGLERATVGQVFIDGVALPVEGRPLALLRADVGMVFQSFNLFAHKTVLENCTLGPVKVRRRPKSEAREKAMALLARVGIAEKADRYPAELSGGQ
jgi:glutamate transport system ATP-binding protein